MATISDNNSYAIQDPQGCTVVKVAPRNGGYGNEKQCGRRGEVHCQGGGEMGQYRGAQELRNNWDRYHAATTQNMLSQQMANGMSPQMTKSKGCLLEWSDDVNGAINRSMTALNVRGDGRCDVRGSNDWRCVNGGVGGGGGYVNGNHSNKRNVNFEPGVWHSPQLANHRHRMRDERMKSATLSPPTNRHHRHKQNGGYHDGNRTDVKPLMGYRHVIVESPAKEKSHPQVQPVQSKGGYEAAKRILNEKSDTGKETNTLGPVHSPMISRRDEKLRKKQSPLGYSQRVSGYRLANTYVNVTISPPKVDTIEFRVKESPMSPQDKRRTLCTAATCNFSTGYDRSTLKPAVPPRTSSLSSASQPVSRSTGNLLDSASTSSGDSTIVGEGSIQNIQSPTNGHNTHNGLTSHNGHSTTQPSTPSTPSAPSHRCQSSGCPLLAAQRWLQQQRKPPSHSLPSPSGLSQSSLGFYQPVSPHSELAPGMDGADTSRDSGFVSIGEEFMHEQHTKVNVDFFLCGVYFSVQTTNNTN
jgi:hypothetical protein